MKIAFAAPQNITAAELAAHLPEDTDEIVPAGTWGTSRDVLRYANTNGIKVTEFLVEYEMFGPSAMMEHFMRAIDYADQVLIFPGDGLPDAENYVRQCRLQKKPLQVIEKSPI
ncbi:MAG: hypothetical protein IKM31_04990 [Oscillospiraceae bacterium]|nr:hypothetical protein [Oscillospiraceae bacterium]